MISRFRIRLALLAFLGLSALSSSFAQVPEWMNYQARVLYGTDPVSGVYKFIVEIYEDETGGSFLYQESHTGTVEVGLVTLPVGNGYDVSGGLSGLFDKESLYLDITMDGKQLDPRIRIGCAGFVMKADKVVQDGVRSNSFALGAILAEHFVTNAVVFSLNGLTDQISIAAGSDLALTTNIVTSTLTVRRTNFVQISSSALTEEFTVAANEAVMPGDIAYYMNGSIRKGWFGPTSHVDSVSDVTTRMDGDRLDEQRFIIAYNSGSDGYLRAGSISGRTVTWGTRIEFVNSLGFLDDFFVSAMSSNRVVVIYEDPADEKGKVRIGDLNGLSITNLGASFDYTPYSSWTSEVHEVCGIDHDRFVVVYRVNGDVFGYGRVGSVSGTNVTFGMDDVFSTQDPDHLSLTTLGPGYIRVAFNQQGPGREGAMTMGSLSGDSVTFAGEFNFTDGHVTDTAIAADSSRTHYVVAYTDSNHVGKLRVSYLTLGPEICFNTNSTYDISVAVLDEDTFVLGYSDSDYGYWTTLQECDIYDSGNLGYVRQHPPRRADSEALGFSGSDLSLWPMSSNVLGMAFYTDHSFDDAGVVRIVDCAHPVGIVAQSRSTGQRCDVIIGGQADVFTNLTAGCVYDDNGNGDLLPHNPGNVRRVGMGLSPQKLYMTPDWIW